MRLHTRASVVALTAVAVGAGLMTTGASAAPTGPTTSTTAPTTVVTRSTTTTTASTSSTSTSAAATRAARLRAITLATRARAAQIRAHRAAVRSRAVAIALHKVRQHPQYVAGAAGPNAFDCSGFTSWVWKRAGHRIARTSWEQRASLTRIPRSQARPGDIALYMNGAHHSEIYIGHGKTVGCSNARTDCTVKPLSGWYADHFTGFYRVI